jgi:4-amino-4-deoxy-L-arabinose transferase-like glycosyltransferase
MIKQILTKHDRKIVVAIILLASGLRFFNLGARSFWFDEASSIRFARLDAATILTAGGSLGHPPGFYFLLHLWRAAGEGDFWLRFPSAFFGVLSVALTYGLARYLFDRPVAQVSAFWMAISPFQLYYAQEVRMYAMTTAVIPGLMWGFFHGVREEDKKGWLAYGVLSVLGFYTYYFVGFVMAALSLWWLLDRRRWKTFGMFFITNGAVALTSAPLLISYISQTNSILAKAVSRGSASTGLARPHILSPFTTLYYMLFSHVFPPEFWVAPGFFCVVGMLALSMLLWARGHHVSRLRRSTVTGLLLVIWIPILFSLVFSWIFRPVYIERSFVICVPSLVLLFAFGALESPKLSPTPYVAVGFTLLLILGAVFYVVRPDPTKPPIRDAVETVVERMQEGDVSLHLQGASYFPALIYSPMHAGALLDVGQRPRWGSKKTYQPLGGDVVTLDEALPGAGRLWLTVMPGFNGENQRRAAESMAAQCVLLEVWDWGRIQLYLYDLGNCEQLPIGQPNQP